MKYVLRIIPILFFLLAAAAFAPFYAWVIGIGPSPDARGFAGVVTAIGFTIVGSLLAESASW